MNKPNDNHESCPRCEGKGEHEDTWDRCLVTCRLCGGTGKLPTKPTEEEAQRFKKGRWI